MSLIEDHDSESKVIIDLVLILDTSPSMRPGWDVTLSGLNEYVQSLRAQENDLLEYRVSFHLFSNTHITKYDRVNLDTLPTFTNKNLPLQGSGTALYDAVGKTLNSFSTENPALFVIITDGEDNSSREFRASDVTAKIKEREALGNYTFTYLGAAAEAWSGGSVIATSLGNMRSGTVASRSADFSALNVNTASYSTAMGQSFRSEATMKSVSGEMIRNLRTNSFYSGSSDVTPDEGGAAVLNANGGGIGGSPLPPRNPQRAGGARPTESTDSDV